MMLLWLLACSDDGRDFIKVEEVRITPRSAYTSDVLQARVTVDSEGDVAPRLNYSWYVDGLEVVRGLGRDSLDGQVHFQKNI